MGKDKHCGKKTLGVKFWEENTKKLWILISQHLFALLNYSSLLQVAMDQRLHRSQHPNSSHHSAYRRYRDDTGNDLCENKRLRPNHSGPTPGQSSCSSQALSTRRELYERDFPVYKQPVEVGSFSLDSHRRFFNDKRQMRYFVEPERNPNFDLRDGYKDRFIKRDDSVKEKLDHILKWILANRLKLKSRMTTASSW